VSAAYKIHRSQEKTMTTASSQITSLWKKERVFKPPKEFTARANIKTMAQYRKMYAESIRSPEKFWAKMAKELHWFKPWRKVLAWKEPFSQWFVGGKINVSYNCLDRHLSTWRKNKAALIWEGEPGEVRVLTYQQLHTETCKFANVLKQNGIKKGNRVMIYMPLVPEAAVAMLACTRIGAPHCVVFGGFSAQALIDRIHDCQAKMVITADGGYRRGNIVPLKVNVDEALAQCPTIEKVIVLKRAGNDVKMEPGRDLWWHEAMMNASDDCPAASLDSEHPLFILYTSGSTGKPKGVLHTTGGYLLQAFLTTKYVFDIKDDDTFWCTADIGWVTGHTYVVYGPLANGATSFMYEGAPNFPEPDRFWSIIERHRINIFYTAPTAIRAFMRWGDHWPQRHDLSSLRLLGTVGEPINPEAWMWYYRIIGKSKCPIVDTWWQTETGGILITPLPGITPTKPGSATLPFFGVLPDIVDAGGKSQPANVGGFLVIRKPWPAMLRTIYGDPERYKKQYWSQIKHCYFTGDGARRDKDGYFWIVGRIDDVLNVAGHRIGTAEVESALVSHPKVAEAAVVGRPDELKGQAIVAFVTPRGGIGSTDGLAEELRAHVAKEIGPIAKPDDIRFTDALPKTRSGKIMRRLLKEIATSGEVKGDTTTLEDFGVLAKLREEEE
jgi:acetyl-CoA synthetase